MIDIEALITKGLFLELYRSTKNIETGYTPPTPSEHMLASYSRSSPEPNTLLGRKFSFREILQRTVGLQPDIKQSLGVPSLLFPGDDFRTYKGYPNESFAHIWAQKERCLKYFGDFPQNRMNLDRDSFLLSITKNNIDDEITRIPKKLGARDQSNGRNWGVGYAPRMSADVTLNTLLSCFACAYFLGMLARYFPTFWAEGLTFPSSTSAFPLFQNASELLPEIFFQKWLEAFDLWNADVEFSG